jgi:hypothetical protein
VMDCRGNQSSGDLQHAPSFSLSASWGQEKPGQHFWALFCVILEQGFDTMLVRIWPVRER